MNSDTTIDSAQVMSARQASRASTAFGAVLTALGIFAVMAPMFTGVAVTVLVGMLLLAAGLVETVFAFRAESFGEGALKFLFGGLTLLAGAVILAMPGRGLGVLTAVLAVFFLAGGVIDFVLALKLRSEGGWGWVLFSAIASILFGILILVQWPVSGIWAVGLYVGVRLLIHGWMLIDLGRTGREALTNLQDIRIDMLEQHARDGAGALQETQATLADHTAMLLALDNELRKKVSSSEIDPAIVELNQKLGEAREKMKAAAEAARESWSETQKEAHAAFEKLQQSASKITGRLKKELRLEDEAEPSEEPGD
jgi:uncharacterized membrane protein HdeD (DUF308 family)